MWYWRKYEGYGCKSDATSTHYQNQNQNNFISETYNVSNITINLLLMGANSWKPI